MIKHSTCISEATFADTIGNLSKDCKWKGVLNSAPDLQEYLKMACDGREDPVLKKIIPIIDGLPDVVYYHACKGNIYNALKRQSLEVTDPDPVMISDFLTWYDNIFETEIKPLLVDFQYSYEDWFNHLTASQQKEIIDMPSKDESQLKKKFYTMFCKCEKQIVDGVAPKNRCICAPNAEYKYVLGPIVYRLEQIFKDFKGYGVGKNWTEKEELFNQWDRQGFTKIVQGDGSAFDRSQKLIHKTIEKKIYEFIAPFVTHVPQHVFEFQAFTYRCKIFATHVIRDNGSYRVEDLGYIEMADAVQSGNMDTTFANTLRMSLYNRYTIEVILRVPRDAYDLTCAGDDFAVALQQLYTEQDISAAYYKTFATQKTGTHGLGQILKYLKFGGIDTIDFCSTETFWSKAQNSWKIVRQLHRFLTLTPWSHTALGLSCEEQDNYMNAQYEANLKWMDGLPIFTEYNNLLKRPTHKLPPKKGAAKIILPVRMEHLNIVRKQDDHLNWLTQHFSRDEVYAMKDRISSKVSCAEDYLQHLDIKYDLSANTVANICEELRQTPVDGVLYSPALVEACAGLKTDERYFERR